MKIRIKEISLDFLGTQVLERCPSNASKEFEDTYLSFVCIFFEELTMQSDVFILSVDPFITEVDLTFTIDDTLERIGPEISTLAPPKKMEAWHAIDLAAKHAHEVLSFAYEDSQGDKLKA